MQIQVMKGRVFQPKSALVASEQYGHHEIGWKTHRQAQSGDKIPLFCHN